MFQKTVRSATGELWQVGLRLLPERQGVGLRERLARPWRKDEKESHWYDWLDPFDLASGADSIRAAVILLVLGFVFVLVLVPLVLLLLDLLWLALMVFGAAISFLLLRRPVTIVAASEAEARTWRAPGFFAALRKKAEIEQALARGARLP